MYYRIHFEPYGAYWCIQFRRWFCWVNVVGGVLQNRDVSPVILQFDTLQSAEEYVEAKGISQSYHRAQTASRAAAIFAGAPLEAQS